MPLVSFGLAKAGSQSSFDALQKAIDYLTCKAKTKLPFSEDEKTYLIEIYESFSVGGKIMGYSEAAALANHYVHGDGAPLTIDAAVYRTSTVVRDTSAALKDYIRMLMNEKRQFAIVTSSDNGFLHTKAGRGLGIAAGRSIGQQGYVKRDGYLLAEQNNERLQKANNRFLLRAQSSKVGNGQMLTRWSVDDVYEFEPFSSGDIYTEIVISDSFVLKISDGLSHYMTVLGIAKKYPYLSSWTETWAP